MRVMLTGATGFVGFHTALALLDAGHEVSLLVRSVDKMHRLFGLGRIAHYTQGDITDVNKVRLALQGCDALVHSAAMVSTHAADAQQVYRTNVDGTATVISAAIDLGVGSIVHVSSVTALYDPAAQLLDGNSPPGKAASGYGHSKVACEQFVRKLQDAGQPLVITYPASVIGPDDPGLTEPHVGLQTYLAKFIPLMPSGNQYVDVRDVAQVHLRLLERGATAGRYTLGGHYISWREHGPLLESITGRKPRQIPLNAGLMRFAGRLFDRIGPHLKLDLPLSAEGIGYATAWVPLDNSGVEQALDFHFRPLQTSFEDTIAWLYRAGHITRQQAGRVVRADDGLS
jgi:nucleoside-diphosphate-sugar epimerase